MKIFQKDELPIDALKGRGIIRVVGKDSASDSKAMTVGYALYSDEYGEMEPHHHAEETVVVTSSDKGYVEYGGEPDHLLHRAELKTGTVLHIPPNEWHVFKYGEGGHVEIVFIYGGTDNVRPEDNK